MIYEIHVKDFSWDPASGVPAQYRGKFKALTLEHTTLNGDGEHPACLAYLRELGITHVQLMPVYDFGSVDEGGDDSQFNWGYDPVNYNVPRGLLLYRPLSRRDTHPGLDREALPKPRPDRHLPVRPRRLDPVG